jgi:hypothetical protein
MPSEGELRACSRQATARSGSLSRDINGLPTCEHLRVPRSAARRRTLTHWDSCFRPSPSVGAGLRQTISSRSRLTGRGRRNVRRAAKPTSLPPHRALAAAAGEQIVGAANSFANRLCAPLRPTISSYGVQGQVWPRHRVQTIGTCPACEQHGRRAYGAHGDSQSAGASSTWRLSEVRVRTSASSSAQALNSESEAARA